MNQIYHPLYNNLTSIIFLNIKEQKKERTKEEGSIKGDKVECNIVNY